MVAYCISTTNDDNNYRDALGDDMINFDKFAQSTSISNEDDGKLVLGEAVIVFGKLMQHKSSSLASNTMFG